MMSLTLENQTPIAPPSYQRAQAKQGPALHINALTLVTTLHLLMLCHLAVRLAHRRFPPPLPAGPGGTPRTYSEESLLLTGRPDLIRSPKRVFAHLWQGDSQL